MRMSVPMEFPGTAEERAENFAQHSLDGEPGDERCVFCDCRPSYISAGWPCGAEVPRVWVGEEEDR